MSRLKRIIPYVFLLSVPAVLSTPTALSAATEQPPNVLLVTLDTTRADRLGSYGDKAAETPALDRIATRGVPFQRVSSPAPLTLPAHASIFSGTLPRHHGVRDNTGFTLSSGVSTLAEAFAGHGYETAAFVSAAVVERGHGLERGFQHYDDHMHYGSREAFQYVERGASQVVDAALARIPELPEPWFVWVHFYDPHAPYIPPEPFRSRFAKDPYRGEIAFVDRELGRMLEAVRQRSSGAPVIVVAGDHGESLGDHGEETHGLFLYEAATRVPWLMEGPGIRAGRTVETRVSLIDLAPTLLDTLDLPPLGKTDGVSRLKEIAGKRTAKESVELEAFLPAFSYGLAPLRALIEKEYKYIEAPTPELYNLQDDPGERTNLALRETDRLRRMRKNLRQQTEDDEPVPRYIGQDAVEQRRRLASLGYLSGAAKATGVGRDPKDAIAAITEIERGRRAFYEGRTDEACERLERVLRGWPSMTPARLLLVRAHASAGRRTKAIAHARKAWDQQPGDPLIGFHLAGALSVEGAGDQDLREAASLYRRVLSANPRDIEAILDLEAIERRRNESAAADSVVLQALDLGLQDPTLFAHRAAIALRRSQPEQAVAWFRRAEDLAPCENGVARALGRMAEIAGDRDGMRSAWERAWHCRPDGPLAMQLGDSWSSAGHHEHADDWYRRVLEQVPADSDLATAARRKLERKR
jgi:arylsulfatase A-like enzyme/Tfp pilus assembly protein PilF